MWHAIVFCFVFFFSHLMICEYYICIVVFWSRYFCKVMADLLTERPCSQLDVFFLFRILRKLPREETTLETGWRQEFPFPWDATDNHTSNGKEGVTMIFTMCCACFSQLAWEKEVTPIPDWGVCIQVPFFVGHFAAVELPLSWKKR